MSEDEAIERLQEILDFKKNTIDKIEDPIEREIEGNCYIEEMPFEAIQTILDLYKQEKEKNKELENADLTIVYMNGFYDGEDKWKEKIKAKIKEIKAKKDFPEFADYEWSDTEKILFHQADILDDLLEED